VIAALSLLAGARLCWSRTRPWCTGGRPAGQQRVASRMRALLAGDPREPARIQDSYGYRAFPQVHGPAADSLGYATQVVTTELNSASENPLVDPAGQAVWHNGNFHAAYVGLALDSARAALFQTAALSAAPAGHPGRAVLHRPACVRRGHPGQLGHHDPGVRRAVRGGGPPPFRQPGPRWAARLLSRGVEEHAGFSTQSARASTDGGGGLPGRAGL